MQISRIDVINTLKNFGLTQEQALECMRTLWKVGADETDNVVERHEARKKRSVNLRRDAVMERAWRELLAPLNAKIRQQKAKLTDRRPSEQEFYRAALAMMEKTRDRIEGARAKANHAPEGAEVPIAPTPSQVAFAMKLPNNGLHWVDWVPQRVRQALQVEEDRIHSLRTDTSRKPNIFGVDRKARDVTLIKNHTAAITADRDSTRVMVETLMNADGALERVRIAKLKIHIRLCDAALRALKKWPLNRPVPPNPLHILGVSPQALDEATRQNPAVLDPTDPEYEEVARTVIAAAQARVAAGKKQRERAVARAMVDANNEVAHVPAGHSSGRPPAPVRPRPIKEAPPTTLGIPVSPGVDDEMRRHVLEMFPAKGDARHAGGTTIAGPGEHMAWLDEIDEDDA